MILIKLVFGDFYLINRCATKSIDGAFILNMLKTKPVWMSIEYQWDSKMPISSCFGCAFITLKVCHYCHLL